MAQLRSVSRGNGNPGAVAGAYGSVLNILVALLVLSTCQGVFASQKVQGEQDFIAIPGHAPGELYALFVGIGKYKNSSIPALNFPAKDAKDFAALLKAQKHLFKKTNVKVLLDEQATRSELEKYLYYQMRKAGKNDTILIFLSGHGAADPYRPDEFFFLSHEADPEFLEATSLNMSGLRFLKGLDCPRVVLIADSCHAGGFSKERTKALVNYRNFVRDFTASSGKVVISSSRPDQSSLEMPDLSNGVFTHFFIEALKGKGDQDSDGIVTINEAYNYVYSRTKDVTKGAQHPQFEGTVEGLFPLAAVASLDKRPPVSTGYVPRTATILELQTDPGGVNVYVDNRFVGRSAEDGHLHIKYLPMETAIAVTLRKDGWLERVVGPFYFTGNQPQIKSGLIRLQAAIASLQVSTEPGEVTVKVNGEAAGTTDKKGSLTINEVKVAVPIQVEFEKHGFRTKAISMMVPPGNEGRIYEFGGKVVLTRETQVAKPSPAPERAKEDSREAVSKSSAVKSSSASQADADKPSEAKSETSSDSYGGSTREALQGGGGWGGLPGWGSRGRTQKDLQGQ
ncbi:MAG: caspase family protein [Thermodesulfobacteriota bacterium]